MMFLDGEAHTIIVSVHWYHLLSINLLDKLEKKKQKEKNEEEMRKTKKKKKQIILLLTIIRRRMNGLTHFVKNLFIFYYVSCTLYTSKCAEDINRYGFVL